MDVFDEDVVLGRLEPCQLRCAMRMQRLTCRIGSVAQFDERDKFFTPAIARAAHHQCIGDRGMRTQYFLDLLDEHLFAAGIDDQRIAAVQPQGAVLLETGAVTGYHHPLTVDLGKGLTGGVGIIEVPERDSPFSGSPTYFALPGPKKAAVVLGQDQSALAQCEGVGPGVTLTVPEPHVAG